MLTRKRIAQMEFDLDKVVELSRDKPGLLSAVRPCALPFGTAPGGRPGPAELAGAKQEALTDAAEMR